MGTRSMRRVATFASLRPLSRGTTCTTYRYQSSNAMSAADKEYFAENGYLLVQNLISKDQVEELRSRWEPLFDGDFPTGLYPDEWHWRKGLSLPDVTREI